MNNMNRESNQKNKIEKQSNSFIKNLWTGIINVVILGIAGYLGLILTMGILWLTLPPLNELSQDVRIIIDKFYQGYVTAWGLGTIISFFTAFSGFNLINKFKNLSKKNRSQATKESTQQPQATKINITCQNCQTKYSVPIEYAGKKGKCKNCGATILVSYLKHENYIFQSQQRNDRSIGKLIWLYGTISIIVIGFIIYLTVGAVKNKNDLQEKNDGIYQSDQTIINMLQAISQNINAKCPLKGDKYTLLLSTIVVNHKIVYSYKLDINLLAKETGRTPFEIRKALKQNMINNFCTNPDFDAFKQYGIEMEYKYQNIDGTHLFQFTIDIQVCKD